MDQSENGFEDRLRQLERLLQSYGTVALGFSGGVDSTFLAAVLARCMPERALLVHMDTPFVGTPERESFEREAKAFGLPVAVIEFNPFSDADISANPPNRCYFCKRADFVRIAAEAEARGYDVVIDGSNADDVAEERPGMHAMRELGVHSPLREAGWHKEEERKLLHAWGYEVWNMPAGACLATRIPAGEPVTREKIELVRACEDHLHELGLRQVRARLVAGQVRVQAAPDDLTLLTKMDTSAPDAADMPASAGECGAIPRAVPLPVSVIEAFRSFGASDIRPYATLYRYGSTSRSA